MLFPLLFSASSCKLYVVQNAAILGPCEQHLLQGNPLELLNSVLKKVIKEADSLLFIFTF